MDPSTTHQQLLTDLATFLNMYVLTQKLGRLMVAPVAIKIDEGNVMKPDILYISMRQIQNKAVEITENGCTSTSSCFNVLVLGLETFANNVAFNVYPNPASMLITIEMSEVGTIELYNATGQLIWSQTTQTKQLTKDISNLPSGVYNIRFVYEGGTAVKPFVVRQ